MTKTQSDLRVYVTDRSGTVVFDSLGRDEGRDYLHWRDVELTLQGGYGARTTPDDPANPGSAVMYVGAPIHWNNQIVGVVSVGKPVRSFGQFLQSARDKLLVVGITSGASVILLALLVSVWLVRPFGLIGDYLRYARSQKQVNLPRLGLRALGALGAAYDEMRDALAGRSYVEEYVQTLTHEIKSPLSAIRGAAELLQEPMPEERRAQFLKNIGEESKRIQDLIDRLLQLSSLEKRRGLTDVSEVALDELLGEVMPSLAPVADARQVSIAVSGAAGVTAHRRALPVAARADQPAAECHRLLTGRCERRGFGDGAAAHGRDPGARPRSRRAGLRRRSGVREVLLAAAPPLGPQGHRPGACVRQGDRRAAPRPHRVAQPSRRRCGGVADFAAASGLSGKLV